jgi:hypothetical protein
MLDVALLDRATKSLGKDIREVVSQALALPMRKAFKAPQCERRPIPIRLTLFQDNILTDEDVEGVLRGFLEENS